jgi:hypothetical protein
VGDTRAGQLHLAQAIRASAAAATAAITATTAVTSLCSVLSVSLPAAAWDSAPLRTLQQRWTQQYVTAYGLPEPSVLAAAAQAAAVQLVADSTSDSTTSISTTAVPPPPPHSVPRESPFLTESAGGGRGPPRGGSGHVSGHVAGANDAAVGAAAFQHAHLFDAMLAGDSDEASEFENDGAEEFVDDMAIDEAMPPQVGFGESPISQFTYVFFSMMFY